MKQVSNLKDQVDSTTDIDTKRSITANAGTKLNDDELDTVAGGKALPRSMPIEYSP